MPMDKLCVIYGVSSEFKETAQFNQYARGRINLVYQKLISP